MAGTASYPWGATPKPWMRRGGGRTFISALFSRWSSSTFGAYSTWKLLPRAFRFGPGTGCSAISCENCIGDCRISFFFADEASNTSWRDLPPAMVFAQVISGIESVLTIGLPSFLPGCC